MSLKYTMEAMEIIDDPSVNGEKIVRLFEEYDAVEASSETVKGDEGSTDFIKILIKGSNGKSNG